MKRFLLIGLVFAMVLSSCTSSFTTVATPEPTKKMTITSGDLPNKDYTVLGFMESAATSVTIGFPTENQLSKMKTRALNHGIVSKAEGLGADAVISVDFRSTSRSTYIFFLETHISVTGTAIKFK